MSRSLTAFVSLNLIILLLTWMLGGFPLSIEVGIAALLICFLGIPHGAIDHVLFMQNTKASPLKFYGLYFTLILFVILIWTFLPLWGLASFLLLSAYHFGQSEFVKYGKIPKHFRPVLYMFWGSSILAGLCAYNQSELVELSSSNPDLTDLNPIFESDILPYILTFTTLGTLGILLRFKKYMGIKVVLIELTILFMIHLSFYLNSVLVGFSIYFATLHSLEVLQSEFVFLKERFKQFSLKRFASLLTPYTLISLIGILALLALSHFSVINASKTLVLMISISALTLPHTLVMENFYSTSIKAKNNISYF